MVFWLWQSQKDWHVVTYHFYNACWLLVILNYSRLLQAWTGTPGWRPRQRKFRLLFTWMSLILYLFPKASVPLAESRPSKQDRWTVPHWRERNPVRLPRIPSVTQIQLSQNLFSLESTRDCMSSPLAYGTIILGRLLDGFHDCINQQHDQQGHLSQTSQRFFGPTTY